MKVAILFAMALLVLAKETSQQEISSAGRSYQQSSILKHYHTQSHIVFQMRLLSCQHGTTGRHALMLGPADAPGPRLFAKFASTEPDSAGRPVENALIWDPPPPSNLNASLTL